MGPVARGLLLTAMWMGLALGFTEVLSNALLDAHFDEVQQGAETVR